MNPCEGVKNIFSGWLSSSNPAALRFRQWAFAESKRMHSLPEIQGKKGFMALEFDQPVDTLLYLAYTPSVLGKFMIIEREGLPESFRPIYDETDINTHFLLYVVVGKKHPGCISLMRQMAGI